MWNSVVRNTFPLVLALALVGVFFAPARAKAATDWQAAERACRAKCPPFPRFSGVETDAQYQDRMRRQAAHDKCFLECAHKSSSGFAPSFTPIDEAAKAYYRRNGVKMGK
ncbi:hypothetical protein [Paucidesulfovibrio longus]|uniref:hypothetical protein n=1 Tax=Paucidesulfovibrio longus TaxID=889 RepID=UPI0003B69BD9|nr:hypothetical protein [Paucidesulfovibrio longus]